MSAYEVCPDHIRYLVDLGRELEIRCVVLDGRAQNLNLSHREDRQLIGDALVDANQHATSTPQQFDISSLVDAPQRFATSSLRTLAESVQALQWVRSYCYQASSSTKWAGSAARAYTDQLSDSLEARIIRFFNVQWDYSPSDEDSVVPNSMALHREHR